jgi:tetratricopeptide (TPR) repeat protein
MAGMSKVLRVRNRIKDRDSGHGELESIQAMRSTNQLRFLTALLILWATLLGPPAFLATAAEGWTNQATSAAANDSLAADLESVRRTRNEAQLQSLKAQLEQRIAKNSPDAQEYYALGRVQAYLVDAFEMRNDKKDASAAIDRAIEAAEHAVQRNDKFADAHSLLADLYGRKISYGGMFAGPKFGPKVGAENKKAMALDDKNPRVWASLGRQYLMAPKMFGGDVGKAIESFQKSLELDPSQDETWDWQAVAYEKRGDKTKARAAIEHALQLNPQNQHAKKTAAELDK